MECCRTEIPQNCNYEQFILNVGIYRPLDSNYLPYEAALANVVSRRKKDNAATLMARDFNINPCGAVHANWAKENDLWILADPYTPTYRAGAVDDAKLTEVGTYLQQGILPSASGAAEDAESANHYPAWIREDPFV